MSDGADVAFYSYNDIVKKWLSWLTYKGVPKEYANSFLQQRFLITGSSNAPAGDTTWSGSHVFYQGTPVATGQAGLYFISSDIFLLSSYIIAAYPHLDRAQLGPGPSKLIRSSAFTSPPTPIRFQTAEAIQKHRQGSALTAQTATFEQSKAVFDYFRQEGKGSVLAIDIESWESDHTIITEIGWSYVGWRRSPSASASSGSSGSDVRAVEHFIIDEHQDYENGRYSPNNKYNFSFGNSDTISLSAVLKKLDELFVEFAQRGPLVLVFHNASAEKEYFKQLGVDSSAWRECFDAPSTGKGKGRSKGREELLIDFSSDDEPASSSVRPTTSGEASSQANGITDVLAGDGRVYVQDTQKLFAGSGLPGAIRQIGLKNALDKLDLPSRKLHNAGNDAHYTLAVYLTLMGDDTAKERLAVALDGKKEKERQRKIEESQGWGSW